MNKNYPTLSMATDYKQLLDAGVPAKMLKILEHTLYLYERYEKSRSTKTIEQLAIEDEDIYLNAISWWNGFIPTKQFIRDIFNDFEYLKKE